jgi:hypothetical protein
VRSFELSDSSSPDCVSTSVVRATSSTSAGERSGTMTSSVTLWLRGTMA